jgi:type II secretory pathway component GspD/PulD (secretin)
MRIALALLSAIPLLAFGCGRPAVPVMAAAAPPAPNLQLKPVPFLNEVTTSPESTNVIIQWEVLIADFPVDAAERLGFAKLFETIGEKNAVLDAEKNRSELAQIARAHSNVVLNLAAGAYAASCSFEESTNLIDRLQTTAGVDILSQPKLTTRGTNEAILSVSSSMTVVLAASGKSGSNAFVTTNISVGPTVTVHLVNRSADKVVIETAARLEGFGGYEGNNADTPHPIFLVTTMGTRAELNTNEVLLLGGPKQMKVTKSVDRVAYLSDIPGIGRLFTKTQVQTNFIRTLVIVRPRVN